MVIDLTVPVLLAGVWLVCGALAATVAWRAFRGELTDLDRRLSRVDLELDAARYRQDSARFLAALAAIGDDVDTSTFTPSMAVSDTARLRAVPFLPEPRTDGTGRRAIETGRAATLTPPARGSSSSGVVVPFPSRHGGSAA